MTLRDDVRDYFEREARRQPAPASLRADATSQAAANPTTSASLRWAAVVAAMLAVAIVIGLVTTGAFKQTKGVVPIGPQIPVTPGAHGLVFDVSFANSSDGWALVAVLGTSPDQYYVESTHDGGATWVNPVAVGLPYVSGNQPRHIHFIDRDNGFVYGGPYAYATHDGGRTWVDAGLTSYVVAITGQEGVAWGVTVGSTCIPTTLLNASGLPNCQYAVHVSADGGKTWLKTAPLPELPLNSQSWRTPGLSASSFGITGLLASDINSNALAMTTDDGTTWTKITSRCPNGTESAATADGHEIWAICAAPPASPQHEVPLSYVLVSDDGGKTWLPRTGVLAGVAMVLSPVVGSALVATGISDMQISHDVGVTWSTCVTDPTHPRMLSASFSADGRLGVALGAKDFSVPSASGTRLEQTTEVWVSRDGGNTWNRTAGQP